MATTINASASAGLVTTADTSGVLQLQTAGTTAVTVDASQNVGIGTNSPAAKLDVNGNILLSSTPSPTIYCTGSQNLFVQVNTGATVFSRSNGSSESMRIDSSGNVGIGITNPSANGQLAVLSPAGGIAYGLKGRSSDGYGRLQAWDRSGTVGTGSLAFFEDGTIGFNRSNTGSLVENARIDSSGNLLVGTTTAIATGLTIQKSTASTNAICWVENTRNVSGDWTYRSTLGTNNNNSSSVHFAGTTNGAGTWYLLGNGTSSWSSDSRLKKNIETTRDGYVEDVCKLRVVKYHWNNNEDGAPKELGLIAQEVEQVFPSLVMDQLTPSEDGEVYKMIKGSVLPYILLKAIQEQQALITQLQADVAALKGATP